MAIAGLVLGIIAVVCNFVSFGVAFTAFAALPLALVGLILSAVAMKKLKNGVSIAGLVLNIIALVFSLVMFSCAICIIVAAANMVA